MYIVVGQPAGGLVARARVHSAAHLGVRPAAYLGVYLAARPRTAYPAVYSTVLENRPSRRYIIVAVRILGTGLIAYYSTG